MDVPEESLAEVADAAHEVIRQAIEAGVFVFGGGIDESVEPVLIGVDGAVAAGGYPQTENLDGGFTVVEVATRQEALDWASKIAIACRCAQQVQQFQYDPLV